MNLRLHPLSLFTLCLLTTFTLPAVTAPDANWPQWRGPLANGVSPTANPPTTWSDTSNLKWKVKIPGDGESTPIIWDQYVFIQTAVSTGKKVATEPPSAPANSPTTNSDAATGGRRAASPMISETPTEFYQFTLLCLDRSTGKTVWQKVAREAVPHEGFRQGDGSFASASPVTDGSHIFAYFGSRGIHCYDFSGKMIWEKDLGKMEVKKAFGEGSSPALFGNTIVINWDHEGDSFIVALNKNTGEEFWRAPRDEKTSWSSPLVIERAGTTQVITTASKKVRSYDLATGKIIWECGGLTQNVIPTPVADDTLVYTMSGFSGDALLAIRLDRTGDLTGSDAIAWSHNKNTSYVPSPLLYGNRLYFLSGNNGMISCYDAKSGHPLINAERLEDLKSVYASPVAAADRVYLVSRNGVTLVLKNSDKLEILATNKLDDSFDASPALAGPDLFLRSHQNLYRISEQ